MLAKPSSKLYLMTNSWKLLELLTLLLHLKAALILSYLGAFATTAVAPLLVQNVPWPKNLAQPLQL